MARRPTRPENTPLSPEKADLHRGNTALLRPETGILRASQSTVEVLRRLGAVPEENVWLETQRSAATRRAYRSDLHGFLGDFGITTRKELRLFSRQAAGAWIRTLDARGLAPTTINRKVSAMASLFAHLVEYAGFSRNPFRDIKRPSSARHGEPGATRAFSRQQARRLLDAPSVDTLRGLRDRAIFAVGLQTGARRQSICGLRVRDFYETGGYHVLRFHCKGARPHTVAIHPETIQRLDDYLAAGGLGDDPDGPLFRATDRRGRLVRKALCADRINALVHEYADRLGLKGRSAHSMRATFITCTLEAGATLEEAQRAAGHVHPSTTQLYDHRAFNPARSACFLATY